MPPPRNTKRSESTVLDSPCEIMPEFARETLLGSDWEGFFDFMRIDTLCSLVADAHQAALPM